MKLILETSHIVLGYHLGMDMILDRIVLGGKSEGIPTHGIQNVIALHSSLSRHDIQRGVWSGVTYVKSLSRRIRELNQRIIFGLGKIVRSLEGFLVIPDLLPLCLHLMVVIRCCHILSSNK